MGPSVFAAPGSIWASPLQHPGQLEQIQTHEIIEKPLAVQGQSNRNRSVGNIVNRVFDSSGPEGKVRGTPQQIIDKYNQLARDAQLVQ
jgi:hypothetical protein